MHRVLLVLRLLVILQIAGDLPFGGSAAARAANGAPANDAPVAAAVAAPLPPWRVPDLAAVPDDAAGALIRRGLDLLTHTTALIGRTRRTRRSASAVAGWSAAIAISMPARGALPCRWWGLPACIRASARAPVPCRTWRTG
ncbi:MAG: hypothetical protein WDN25_22975 [Acetobacteraceae bacterium]